MLFRAFQVNPQVADQMLNLAPLDFRVLSILLMRVRPAVAIMLTPQEQEQALADNPCLLRRALLPTAPHVRR